MEWTPARYGWTLQEMTARLERHTEETHRHTDTQTHRLTRHTARAELPHIPSERTALHHRRFAPRTAQRHATGNATSTVTQTSGNTLATPTSTPRRPTSGGKGRLRGAIARAPEAPAHPCLSIAPRRVGQPTGQALRFLHVLQRRGRGTFHQPSGSFPVYRPPPHVLLRMVRGLLGLLCAPSAAFRVQVTDTLAHSFTLKQLRDEVARRPCISNIDDPRFASSGKPACASGRASRRRPGPPVQGLPAREVSK